MIPSPAMYKDCPLELTADIWLVGNYFFNQYLIRGTRACALVEMGVTAVVDAAIAQLDSLGASPDYLVLVHPHTDHITGLPGLMQRYPGARLVAGEGAREFALHPKALPGDFLKNTTWMSLPYIVKKILWAVAACWCDGRKKPYLIPCRKAIFSNIITNPVPRAKMESMFRFFSAVASKKRLSSDASPSSGFQ
jgi:hypothetical protein